MEAKLYWNITTSGSKEAGTQSIFKITVLR